MRIFNLYLYIYGEKKMIEQIIHYSLVKTDFYFVRELRMVEVMNFGVLQCHFVITKYGK